MISNQGSCKSIRIGSQYLLNPESKLGRGSFGQIYSGINVLTQGHVAIKAEQGKSSHHQLRNEAEILDYLQGGEGIPRIFLYVNAKSDENNYLVMDLLGPSLEYIKSSCVKSFSLHSVLLLAEQMLTRIEYLHIRHIIHRDIKPDNFLMGLNDESSKVYLIDFGLAKRFRDPRTGDHIPYKDGKSLTGTARYASTFTLLGIEQSRRDDLEALVYSLIYLKNGQLPWQGLSGKTKQEKYQKILEKKINISSEALCTGLPENFKKMFEYISSLHFEQRPDYSYLQILLNEMLDKYTFEYNQRFDWKSQLEFQVKRDKDVHNDSSWLNSKEKTSQPLKDYTDVNSLFSLNEEEVLD